MKKKVYIGVDVGGTKISAALIDDSGKVISRQKISTPADAPPKDIEQAISEIIENFFKEHDFSDFELAGIGLGVPGIVDKDQETVLAAPNINLAGYPLVDKLKKSFKVKVLAGNDVNLGVLGEKWLGVARKANDVVGLFWGTGLGGAIIIDGKLVLGAKGAAAEIGHIIIDLDGPESNIGINGTLESYVSRWAIERDIRAGIKKGEKSVITELVDGDLSRIKSKALKEALKREDPLVTKVMQKSTEVLGKACISINHFLNPEMIILGGGVVEACGDFILPIVKNMVKNDPFFATFDKCKVVASELADDAVMIGAVALVKFEGNIERRQKTFFYPSIEAKNGSGVLIDNRLYKKDIYVRADGKVKTFDMDNNDASRVSNKLGIEELRKVCKKHPELLIIASGKKPPVELTPQAIKYLKNEKVQYKFLLQEEAIDVYNNSESRRAILICQN